MVKFKKKAIAILLTSTMLIGAINEVVLTTKDMKLVYAETKALSDAKAKISHLTKSIKGNYLGLKNQATWQLYIAEARKLIKKIPNSEKAQKDALTTEINRDEALVNALSRINHVEKSTTSKEKGGYGNYLGIKNTKTWNDYLRLAKIDLEKVDQNIFKNQYDELMDRMKTIEILIKGIEDAYLVEYNKVKALFDEAKKDNDLERVKETLKLSQTLGSCDQTNEIVLEMKDFLYQASGANNTEIVKIALKEEGYKEGKNNNTKYGIWFGENYEPWCAMFVTWSADSAGIPESVIPRTSDVIDFLTWSKAKGVFKEKGSYIPEAGDIFINKSNGASHTGIVVSSDKTYFYTIEGNYKNKVAKVKRSLKDPELTGFFTPNYSVRGKLMNIDIRNLEDDGGSTI